VKLPSNGISRGMLIVMSPPSSGDITEPGELERGTSVSHQSTSRPLEGTRSDGSARVVSTGREISGNKWAVVARKRSGRGPSASLGNR
jgi:hypothetical protein